MYYKFKINVFHKYVFLKVLFYLPNITVTLDEI